MHEPRDRPGSSCTATAPGPPGHKGPTQLRGRGGAHAAPHQTKGTALLLRDSASQRMPKEEHQQGRAPAGPSHAESTPGREEAGAHPILPAKPPGGHACLSCLPPGCLPPCGPRVPTLRTTAAWVPVIGPGGARLVTDLCSRVLLPGGPGPSSHACPWSHGAPAK